MGPSTLDGRTAERLETLGVSRETMADLDRYVALLCQWQARINLVSPGTLKDIWSRHILDSAQVFALKKDANVWLDLGSGGGLPGLVIAIMAKPLPGRRVHLVESNRKKAAFLMHVVEALALPAQVHAKRIEDCAASLETPTVVTARALASLDTLLGLTNLLLKSGATALFPKGRGYEKELTEARANWHFSCSLHPSITDPESRILEITTSEA